MDGRTMSTIAFRRRAGCLVAVVALTSVAIVVNAASSAAAASTNRAIASAGTFVAADFGVGWKQTPYHSGSGNTERAVRSIASCRSLGGDFLDELGSHPRHAQAHAQSPNFSHTGTKVNNDVTILADTATAQHVLTTIASPAFADCFRQVGYRSLANLKKKDPKTARLFASTAVDVVPRSLALPADQTAGIELRIDFTLSSGQTVRSVIDLDAARIANTIIGYSVEYAPDATSTLPTNIYIPPLQRLQTAMQAAHP
jgi:hypothetical protein